MENGEEPSAEHLSKTYGGAAIMLENIATVVRTYRAELQTALDALTLHDVEAVAREILDAYERGARIFVCGNGGSAATASHMACDLAKNTAFGATPRVHAHALTDNTALLTALANDLGYDQIFSEQLVQAPIAASDLLIAISGSGASPNVLRAVAVAHEAGARVVGITGIGGGKLAPMADVAIVVASNSMEIVEDVHLVANHAITRAVRTVLQARRAVAIS